MLGLFEIKPLDLLPDASMLILYEKYDLGSIDHVVPKITKFYSVLAPRTSSWTQLVPKSPPEAPKV